MNPDSQPTAARDPDLYCFNPFTEGIIASGKAYTPRKHQLHLSRDLANLPQFLCRPDDIVLLEERPSDPFLHSLQNAGMPTPEFVEMDHGKIPAHLRHRHLGTLRPWAWGPDALELLRPVLRNVTAPRLPHEYFNAQIAQLYSKAWSAAFLAELLPDLGAQPWLCSTAIVGVPVNNLADALALIRQLRVQGFARLVAKQAFGVAGHNSLRLWEPELLPTQLHWLEQALQHRRTLVIEPWLDRVMDFSIQMEMRRDGLRVVGYTGLLNDCRGQFLANWAAPDHAQHLPAAVTSLLSVFSSFCSEWQRLFETLAASLTRRLATLAYTGPLGIDAFVYRQPDGHRALKPIVEINPRYTMGRVALELMQQVASDTYGVFRLLNLSAIQRHNFATFADYAKHLTSSHPVTRAPSQDNKIITGAFCLSDPARVHACLATFEALPHPPLSTVSGIPQTD